MKYMMLMYANQAEQPHLTPEQFKANLQEWQAFEKEAKDAGVYVSFNALAPVADATTVRVRSGKTLTTDGPFAETHETLGGLYIFNCKDLDEATRWAAKMPWALSGSIEVRPLAQYSQ